MSQAQQKQTFALKPDWYTVFFSQVIDYGAKITATTRKVDLSGFGNLFKNFPRGKFKNLLAILKRPQVAIALATIIFMTAGVLFLKGKVREQSAQVFGSQTNFSPQSSVALNRIFEIPIRNSTGAVTGTKLPVTISTIDRSKKILIQGKPATSRDGKTFLILNLDIDNSTNNQLSIRPVDFIRLQDNEGKSFAPDVHNDIVKAEPISIKKTRVGFVVDENQKNFKFLVGEISGGKQTIEISI